MGDYENNGDGDGDGNNDGNNGSSNDSDDGDVEDETSDEANGDTTPTTTNNITVETPAAASGCSTTGNRTAPLGLALALGLVAMGRRKDD
jgi:MYXO-CTERM domain-containing protein